MLSAAAVAGLAVSVPSSVRAANDAYSTNASSGVFSSSFTLNTTTAAANGSASPASGDSLFFGLATTTTVSNNLSSFTFAGLTFNAGAAAFTFSASGNAFGLSGSIVSNSSNAQVINNAMTLAATQTVTANSGAITLGGIIDSGGNAYGITKTGTGILTLSAADTYTGATQVNAGTLTLSGTGGAANSALTIGSPGSGATLASLTLAPSLTSGTVTRATSLSINGNNGTSSNYANLTQTGVAANAVDQFTGALNLNSGLTRVTQNSVAGGNVLLNFGNVTRNQGTALVISNTTGVFSLASQTSNSQNISFTTAPTSTLTNGVQLIGGSGAIGSTTTSVLPFATVSGVLATYTSANGLQALTTFTSALTDNTTSSNNVNISGSTAQTVNAGAVINSLAAGNTAGSTINGSGVLSITSGAVNFTQAATLNVAGLAFGSAEGFIYVQNARTPIINSVIMGSNGLTVALNDTNATTARLVLAGANTYTGVTTFTGNNSALAVNLTNSLALQNTTLDYNNYGASVAFGNGGTTGQSAYTFGGLKGSQNLTLANTNTTPGAVALTVGGDGDSTTFSGILSDGGIGGSLTKAGAGILALTGKNTFTGATAITGGTLTIDSTSNSSASLASTSSVTVSSGATLHLLSSTSTTAAGGANSTLLNNAAAITIASSSSGPQLALDLGGNFQTVASFTIGSASQPSGYYGTSAFFSANTGFAGTPDNTDFSGDGALYVAATPEPASLGILGLGGAALLGRRRRTLAKRP